MIPPMGFDQSPRICAPGADEQRQTPTCEALTVLEVCELAHREVAQVPLYHTEQFDEARVKEHLFEQKCEICARWYRNARRTYERLIRTGKLPAPASPLLVPSAEVEPFTPIQQPVTLLTQACTGEKEIFYRAQPVAPARGLNALPLMLKCQLTDVRTATNPSGWELTLEYPSRENDPEGSDPALLREFDDCLARFGLQTRTEEAKKEVRLGLVESGNLTSSPCPLGSLNPREFTSFTLLGWKKYEAGQ